MTWLSEITLNGQLVQLVPLRLEHKEALLDAAADGELWNLWFTSVPSRDQVDAYLEYALSQQAQGLALPFVVVEKAGGKVIGSTRYCNVASKDRRLEIGYTWYAQRFQRTGVNTECKYLLLGHAFEQLNAIAVEFRTHWFNQRSRNAILRLGAKQDGVLRNHRIGPDGVIRDTVVFSIIESEWPAVKADLLYKITQNK